MTRVLMLVLCGIFLSVQTSYAGTTSSVGSPNVKKGETEIEFRVGFTEDDDNSSQDERLRLRQQIDHGFTDWYAGRIVLFQDDRKGNSFEHNSIRLSNRFHLLKADDYGFDFGARFEYTHADGDKKPSDALIGFYERIRFNDYDLRLNQLFTHDVGEDANNGVNLELRFQLTKKIADNHRFGIESFNDFGNLTELSGFDDQDHDFGPVLKGKLFDRFDYETGYRYGLSDDAGDHNFKLFISQSF